MAGLRNRPLHLIDHILRVLAEDQRRPCRDQIAALIAKKLPGDETVTWIEPKVLKKMAAAAEAAAAEGKAE